MTDDVFGAWALKQLEEHMRRNMLAAKVVRQLNTSCRESQQKFSLPGLDRSLFDS